MVTISVRDGDLVGTLGIPDGQGPFPGVLALGGAEGGIPDYFLRLLVPEGFACLALAYFNTSETQPTLTEVPLERIERGLRWARTHSKVLASGDRLAVVGGSKGGELALLVAATFSDLVGPVVAYTPSSVVWAGIDFSQSRGSLPSSWSLRGYPLPFVPYPADVGPSAGDRGVSVLPIYERGLDDTEAVEEAAIPVEHARGPVLLISGGDDRMWPAARMCAMVVDRMRRAGREGSVRHLNFPDAGHVLFPYHASFPSGAVLPMRFDLGGSPEFGSAAHAIAWPEVVQHLRSQAALGAA